MNIKENPYALAFFMLKYDLPKENDLSKEVWDNLLMDKQTPCFAYYNFYRYSGRGYTTSSLGQTSGHSSAEKPLTEESYNKKCY